MSWYALILSTLARTPSTIASISSESCDAGGGRRRSRSTPTPSSPSSCPHLRMNSSIFCSDSASSSGVSVSITSEGRPCVNAERS
ncbi:MAG: hypothetical protein VXW31_05830, partial [Planctomycetota bacterium]|nr:hypothetical protein [Planctomycetota bacterium]